MVRGVSPPSRTPRAEQLCARREMADTKPSPLTMDDRRRAVDRESDRAALTPALSGFEMARDDGQPVDAIRRPRQRDSAILRNATTWLQGSGNGIVRNGVREVFH